ncbi:MAG: Coq4 family protein [Novosphingobium sp.]
MESRALAMEIVGEDAAYLTGNVAPVASSILVSTSRFLNNPRFRDVYAQMGLKRDGHDLPPAYLIPELNRALAEETDMERMLQLLEAERQRLPEFAAWLDERFVSDWSATDLSGCEEGTVGARIRQFLAESGFEIDFMFRGPPADDYAYLNKRRVQNHDIEHMLTGLDTSQVGEIALIVANAVAIFDYFTPEFASQLSFQPMFLASTSLMRMACHYPDAVPAMLEGFAVGHAVGRRQARPLFMIRWEDWIDVPCAEARTQLGFVAAPAEDHWGWVEAVARG